MVQDPSALCSSNERIRTTSAGRSLRHAVRAAIGRSAQPPGLTSDVKGHAGDPWPVPAAGGGQRKGGAVPGRSEGGLGLMLGARAG